MLDYLLIEYFYSDNT